MGKMENQILGENIRYFRKRAVLSQAELAELLDVSTMTISRIENGCVEIKAVYLLKMAEIFEVEIQDILSGNSVKK